MKHRTERRQEPAEPGQARRGASRRRWTGAVAAVVVAGVATGCALSYYDVFSDTGDVVRFDQEQSPAQAGTPGKAPADPLTRMPTGPQPELRIASTVPEDGTKVMVTTLVGKKSGFTGKVWLWVPPQYKDPGTRTAGSPS